MAPCNARVTISAGVGETNLPHSAAEHGAALGLRLRGRRLWNRIADRGERLAIAAAERPYAATAAILALNASLAVVFALAGEALFSDPAEFFRELMPGTWLSAAELLFVAAIAAAIHRRSTGSRRPRLDNFWGLSAIVFAIFALVELTQPTIFLSSVLTAVGTLAPEGFRDLDAFLLSVVFLAAAAALLRYARELLTHPAAVAVLAVGALLGLASQLLDSTLASTSSEFVAEESLKLGAEAFLIGGYLVVLHRLLNRASPPPVHPRGHV